MTVRMVKEISTECLVVNDMDQQCLWASCVSATLPRAFDSDIPTRSDAINTLNNLLQRFEKTRLLLITDSGSNAKTIFIQVFNAIDGETAAVMASELVVSLKDRDNLGGLSALVDLLNRKAIDLTTEAASSIATSLMNSFKDAHLVTSAERLVVNCMRPLLYAHFVRVFEDVFLCSPLSKSPPIFSFALREIAKDKKFLTLLMKQTTDILNNRSIA